MKYITESFKNCLGNDITISNERSWDQPRMKQGDNIIYIPRGHIKSLIKVLEAMNE